MKKKWCSHIKASEWDEYIFDAVFYSWLNGRSAQTLKYCPFCGKKKPA